MTSWVTPLVLAAFFALNVWAWRRQPEGRLQRRIEDDPDVGRNLVRSARGTPARLFVVFFSLSAAAGGLGLLVRGEVVGVAWLLVAGLVPASHREGRRMAERVEVLLGRPVTTSTQQRIRDRFTTVYAALALVALTAGQVLMPDDDGPTWRLVVAFGLLAVTCAAGLAAAWSQAWVFSERRWSRGG